MAVAIESTASTVISLSTREHEINIPGGVSLGSLILVLYTSPGQVTIEVDTGISGSNWDSTGLVWEGTGLVSSNVFWKLASESSNLLSIDTDFAAPCTALCYVFSGHGNTLIPDVISTYGSASNMDPPELPLSHGSQEYMFIVYGATGGTVIASAAPSSFGSLYTQAGDIDNCSSSAAHRLYTTSGSYDPGYFTNTSVSWITFTIAIAPPLVNTIGLGNIAYYNIG